MAKSGKGRLFSDELCLSSSETSRLHPTLLHFFVISSVLAWSSVTNRSESDTSPFFFLGAMRLDVFDFSYHSLLDESCAPNPRSYSADHHPLLVDQRTSFCFFTRGAKEPTILLKTHRKALNSVLLMKRDTLNAISTVDVMHLSQLLVMIKLRHLTESHTLNLSRLPTRSHQ